MDIYKKFQLVTVALFLSVVLSVMLVGCLVYSYVKLQTSYPLENLRGAIIQPVSQNDELLEFKGMYDRHVQCNMTTFVIHLHNTETNDMIMLTPNHLAKPLPINAPPGLDIEIQFSLFMPDTIYPGTWKPRYVGFYICHLGIFLDQKVQVINPEAFVILGEKPTKL